MQIVRESFFSHNIDSLTQARGERYAFSPLALVVPALPDSRSFVTLASRPCDMLIDASRHDDNLIGFWSPEAPAMREAVRQAMA